MADSKAVTIRTRKFMTNRLLSRKQFVSFVVSYIVWSMRKSRSKEWKLIQMLYQYILQTLEAEIKAGNRIHIFGQIYCLVNLS